MQPVSSNGAPISPSDPSQVEIGEGRIEGSKGRRRIPCSLRSDKNSSCLDIFSSGGRSFPRPGIFGRGPRPPVSPAANQGPRRYSYTVIPICGQTVSQKWHAMHASRPTTLTLSSTMMKTLLGHWSIQVPQPVQFSILSSILTIFPSSPRIANCFLFIGRGGHWSGPENPCPPNETRHSHYSIIRPTQKPSCVADGMLRTSLASPMIYTARSLPFICWYKSFTGSLPRATTTVSASTDSSSS